MTNGNLRHLDDLRKRVAGEHDEPAADHEPPVAETAVPPLDPYGAHEITVGTTRMLHPKTKAFVEVPAVACSCKRVGGTVPSPWAAGIVAQLHAMEVGMVRIARAVGINLDEPAGMIERAVAGDEEAIADLHRRREELVEQVEQRRRENLAADLAADLDADLDDESTAEVDPVAERVATETGSAS